MNYYEARQRKETGLWDWTVMNDGHVHVARPCAEEDCKHATREEAERHYWEWEIGNAEQFKDAMSKRKCAAPGCAEWTNNRVRVGPVSVYVLCEKHADAGMIEHVHPFEAGTQIASSW